jgi:hypothetical protein
MRTRAKWGALIGAVSGAILLGLQHEQVDDASSAGKAAALGAWSGGLFGGLIGAVVGAVHPREQWERIQLAQAQAPTAGDVSREVRSACDAAHAIAAATPGVTVRRRTGIFRDELIREPVLGCGLSISGSFASARSTGDAATRLRQDFELRGWQEMGAYSADGPDGTSFAFRRAGVACLVRGTWNGGTDDGPTVAAKDEYEVAVFCTSPEFSETRSP